LNKSRDNEVFINPSVRRPSVLRSMIPVLLARSGRDRATLKVVHTFRPDRESRKTP